jgi:hypothetical protein
LITRKSGFVGDGLRPSPTELNRLLNLHHQRGSSIEPARFFP